MANYKDIHGTKVEIRDDDPSNPVNGQVWYNSGTLKGHKLNPAGAWATGGNLNTARDFTSGAGTQTAALCFGGLKPPGSTLMGENESYNGTAWTELADLNTARARGTGTGVSNTAALCIAGATPSVSAVTESWNGSSWTEVGDLNTARQRLAAASNTYTDSVVFGGYTSTEVGVTETWNGSAWTEGTDMSTARTELGGGGATSSSAIAFAGQTGSPNVRTAATEEWNSPGPTTVSFTVS